MGKVKDDLTGNVYDNWEVIEYEGRSTYKCKCKLCGLERSINGYFLKNNKIPKCTCKTDRVNTKGLIDLTNKDFGEWHVLEYAGDKKWKCQCSCGRIQIIAGSDLRNGKTTKCNFTHTNGLESKFRNETDFKELTSGATNLYGKHFGDWEVLYYVGNGMWKCRCSCRNIKCVNEYTLTRGASKSCGHDTTGLKDLTNMDFNNWHVIKRVDSNGNYLCKCKCGNVRVVNRYYLLNGLSRSCGCLANEFRKETNKMVYGAPTAGQAKANRTAEQIELFEHPEKLQKLIDEIKAKNNGVVTVQEIANVTGIGRGNIRNYLTTHNMMYGITISKAYSSYETEIHSMFPNLERRNRSVLDGLEIDFYSPDKKFGIEFNGNYWHSELYKDNLYHINKTKIANNKGVRLLHIFEYDWTDTNKKKIILSMIKSILDPSSNNAVYARNCTVSEIKYEEAREFLTNNHLQGWTSASILLGAFHNGELIGVMTFGKPRFSNDYQYELVRLAWKIGYSVVGGSERMFKYFLDKYNPSSIISYCDVAKFSGYVYNKLGFEFSGLSQPNYVWCGPRGEILTRYKTQKHTLVSRGLGSIDETEVDIMHRLNYYRVFDCGNKVFIWNKS